MKLAVERIVTDESVRIISRLSTELQVKVYLAGGGLRDILLGRRLKDLDFALTGMLEEFPHIFAERLGGSFFWLDRERAQARVTRRSEGGRLVFDFAPVRGRGIEDDLFLRDFTINAMALELAGQGRFIDPLRGEDDLRNGVIRRCSTTSFDDDPLRLLRGVRLAAALGFVIEDGTLDDMASKAHLLAGVAAERMRDELMQILEAPGLASSLRMLHDLGLLAVIVPGGGAEKVAESVIAGGIAGAARAVEIVEGFALRYPDHFQQLISHLGREIEGGASARSLLNLAAFIGGGEGVGRADIWAAKLRLGKRATRMLALLAGETAPLFAALAERPTRRAMFRFFKDREPAGIELILLALARQELSPSISSELVRYYFRDYPQEDEFLSGDEIMALLGIDQGPVVGEAQERLKEAERRGLVDDKEEAREFLRKNLLTKGESMS